MNDNLLIIDASLSPSPYDRKNRKTMTRNDHSASSPASLVNKAYVNDISSEGMSVMQSIAGGDNLKASFLKRFEFGI